MKRIAASIAGIVALVALPATGAPPVKAVLDAENPARSAYVERVTFDIPEFFINGNTGFPTPAGKRYVIEYVAVSCSTPSATDTFPRVRLFVTKLTSPTSSLSFAVPVIQMQSEGGVSPIFNWSGAAQVKLYSDAGLFEQGISIDVSHTDTSVGANCSASVHGYTVGL